MKKTSADRPEQVKRISLLVLGIIGIGYYLFELLTRETPSPTSQICVRVGFVLFLFWLAYPQVQVIVKSISPLTFIVAAVVMLVFIKAGPLIIVPCLVVCALLGILQYAVNVFTTR